MSLWVKTEDVTRRWPPGVPVAEDAEIEVKVEDAEDIVLTAFPDLPARIESGAVRLATVVRVVAGMVIRYFRNPEGKRSESVTTGPFAATNQIVFGGDEPGELYLSDADRAALGSRSRGRAFTVSTVPVGWSP